MLQCKKCGGVVGVDRIQKVDVNMNGEDGRFDVRISVSGRCPECLKTASMLRLIRGGTWLSIVERSKSGTIVE